MEASLEHDNQARDVGRTRFFSGATRMKSSELDGAFVCLGTRIGIERLPWLGIVARFHVQQVGQAL